jgi:hypothetical protein
MPGFSGFEQTGIILNVGDALSLYRHETGRHVGDRQVEADATMVRRATSACRRSSTTSRSSPYR